MTTKTSILEILRTVQSSVDFGLVVDQPGETMDEKRTSFWHEVISYKAEDSGFGHLVDSIMEEGFHGSEIGWDGERITEGHHRLVAAILLCLDEVPTSMWGRCGAHPARDGMRYGHFSAHNSCEMDTGITIEV